MENLLKSLIYHVPRKVGSLAPAILIRNQDRGRCKQLSEIFTYSFSSFLTILANLMVIFPGG